MNWIDGVLIVLLLAAVIVGSKKGMVRELMAFIVFFTSLIITVNYIDNFAAWVFDKLGGSPLVSAFLSFIVLLALSYGIFKLAGLLFYKVADLKRAGRRDQVGGALIGFLRGWVAIGFLTLLTFLFPLPQQFYTYFEGSFLGPTMAKTVPLIYEGTARAHPANPNFMTKIEQALLAPQSKGTSAEGLKEDDRAEVYQALQQMRRFFTTGLGST